MDITAILEPVHSAPYPSTSPVWLQSRQRLPPSKFASSQHQQALQQDQQPLQQYTNHVPKPLPSLSPPSSLSSLASQPLSQSQVQVQVQVQHMSSRSSTILPVYGPSQQRSLLAHQRRQRNDNSHNDLVASSSPVHGTPRCRGKQTKAACIPCRKRRLRVIPIFCL